MRRAGPTLVLWIAGFAFGVGCGEQQPAPAASAAPPAAAASAASPAASAASDRRRTRPLPAFDGRDLEGRPWRTAELLGKRTVVFGFDASEPQAKTVARALARVARERAAHNFEIVGAAAGAADAARALLGEQRLEIRSFADASGELGRRIGVRRPVWLVITDVDGNLLFGEEYFPNEGPDPAGVVEQMLRAQLRLPGRPDASLVDLPLAPPFSAERLEGGERFELASLRGRPAILIFFLHTCPHCHEALGFLKQALADLPAAERPALVGVSVANRTWSVQQSLKEQGLDFFPVLLDPDASIRTAYGALQAVPVVFLIDAEGQIVSRTEGWTGERDPALLRMRLAKLSGQPVPLLLHKTGYSGNEVCSVCHEAEAATWELTNHASAFDTLVRHGADGRGECVSCHVVGYGSGGYQVARPDPGLENVGCETCHGRGGPHLTPDRVRNGSYEAQCQTCHNPEHSLGFEYAAFLPRVSHAANRAFLALPPDAREKLLAERRVPRKDLLPTAAPYVGSAACQSCHGDEHAAWLTQAHARALDTLAAKGKANDPDCLRCHTTGFGKPGGFQAGGGAQPGLAGVGCESCHGPGGEHATETARKQGTILRLSDKCGSCAILQICGTCHDDANDPGFEFEVIDKILRQRHGKEELDIDGGRKAALPPSAALGLLERAFAGGPE